MSARLFAGGKLVLASHNRGKLVEIAELLTPFNVALTSVAELGLPEPEETGMTFRANAELKARAAALAAKLPALSDDSGLAVDALDGAPGIYSARWAGADKDFARAMRRVEDELEKRGKRAEAQRRARFVCALSLAWPDGHCESFEGKIEGWIAPTPRGAQGFGYDPIFVPLGERRSFGEFAPAEKHAISHRADAFRQLVVACFSSTGATRR